MPIELTCAICGSPFKVFPARIRAAQKRGYYPKYCSKTCANIGQPQNREQWSKGLTKETDERVRARVEASRISRQEHPERFSGDNHWTRKRPMTTANLAHMAKMRSLKPDTPTPTQLQALDAGRQSFKGETKETSPAIEKRAKALSQRTKGTKNPKHGERLRKFYEEHPEKHPNFLLAQKGHETSIERIMRLALERENINFLPQHRVGRYFIDFAILSHRIAVEVDGAYWHNPEKDAKRDADLLALGWRVIRFSELRVRQEIHVCISEILHCLR